MEGLKRMAATLAACAIAFGVFEGSGPVATALGLGELQLLVRLGLTFFVLGLTDTVAARFLVRTPHP